MESDKLKILLVENDALVYLDIVAFLESEGYEVLKHPFKPMIDNYKDAIEVCKQTIPHIAILDIQLKGPKDGIEIGQYIRATYFSPVIILSNYNTEENLRRSGLMGADGFVVKLGKPYQLLQLRADIRRLIPLAQKADKIRNETVFLSLKEFIPDNKESFYLTKKVIYNEIEYIDTSTSLRNCVLFHFFDGKRFYYRKNLSETAMELPVFFIRISSSVIINQNHLDRRSKSKWIFYIRSKRFEVTDTYRNEKTLALLTGKSF